MHGMVQQPGVAQSAPGAQDPAASFEAASVASEAPGVRAFCDNAHAVGMRQIRILAHFRPRLIMAADTWVMLIRTRAWHGRQVSWDRNKDSSRNGQSVSKFSGWQQHILRSA